MDLTDLIEAIRSKKAVSAEEVEERLMLCSGKSGWLRLVGECCGKTSEAYGQLVLPTKTITFGTSPQRLTVTVLPCEPKTNHSKDASDQPEGQLCNGVLVHLRFEVFDNDNDTATDAFFASR